MRHTVPRCLGCAVLAAKLLLLSAPSYAQSPAPEPADLWHRKTLTGDWGGLRDTLGKHGVSLDLDETLDLFANVAGGLHRGGEIEGRLRAMLTIDLDELVHWPGGKIVASAYQLHGQGPTEKKVGNLLTISNTEAERSTRLADLYFEQSLFGDALNIRIGQIAADEEFLTSDVAAAFINSTFGWTALNALDLPGGGPAYPLAAPGVRVRYTATDTFSVQGGVFSGNPLGPHRNNPGGTAFPLHGVLALVEATYSSTPAKGQPGLGGTYKLGGWYNSLRFNDLRYDTIGLSLADPLSTGVPAAHHGNFALYVSADHTLWRRPGADSGGLAGFIRAAAAPRQDRSPVYVYLDAGLTWTGTFPGRDDDVVGLAFAWANLSNSLSGRDRDTTASTGVTQSIRRAEMLLEATYMAPVTPWLSLQPDFQYVIHPGGNEPSPVNPSVAVENAVVVGLRSVIKF